MEKKSFFRVISLLFALIWANIAVAFHEADVRTFLNTTGEKFIETLGLEDKSEKYERLDGMFENDVDLQYMGQFALGGHFKLLNEEQKERYFALFERYIKALYKSYPLDFDTKGIDFKILSVIEKGRFIDAAASIDLPEQYRTENFEKITVVFKLLEKEGAFYLVDLKIGEISMLVTLRSRMLEMLKNADNETEWFLEDFEDLTNSNEKNLEVF